MSEGMSGKEWRETRGQNLLIGINTRLDRLLINDHDAQAREDRMLRFSAIAAFAGIAGVAVGVIGVLAAVIFAITDSSDPATVQVIPADTTTTVVVTETATVTAKPSARPRQ